MITSRSVHALCLLGLLAAGCSNKDDGHTVGGRTRSVSSVAASSSAVGTLRLVQTAEAQVPGESGWARVELRGTDDPSATLSLPDGSELPLLADGDALVAQRDWTPADGALAGSYTALWHEDGTRRALTLLAEGDFPAAVTLVEPAGLALLDPASVTVTWSDADFADVRVERASDQTVVFARADQVSPLRLPPLEAGARYRLTVTTAHGSSTAPVRWEARRTTLFDTTN